MTEATRVLVLDDDQVDLHRLVQELAEAKALLEKKNRHLARLYETAYRFVDNVSHEFRTPLTVIKEYCSVLRDRLVGDINEEQCQLLDVMSDRADDLNNMVDDMLDVSKLESGTLGTWRKNCHVSDILDHIRPNLDKKAAVKNVDLEIEITGGLPAVYCDPEKVGRVIVNLAINAIKFCGDSACVRIHAAENHAMREVIIEVRDNGPGISDKNVETLFQRFTQVGFNPRESTKGFGLGLNIAKELVDLNFGSMNVESTAGEGSTFSFSIPYAEPQEVMRRYLDHIERLDDRCAAVSLLHVKIDDRIEPPLVEDVDAFLNHLLRRNDLLFRVDLRKWLIVLPNSASELEWFYERAAEMRNEVNRNRPGDSLPDINMQSSGTWHIVNQKEEILTQVGAALNILEPTYV